MEHDDELRKLLRVWEVPAPGVPLDTRVWRMFHARRQGRLRWVRQRGARLRWVGLAAGVALALGTTAIWESSARAPRAVTLDLAAYQPLPNGAITAGKGKRR